MFELIGSPLYQWNKWRKIEITDTKVAFVDFALEGETVGTRVKVESVEGVLVADIPNDKLWSDGKIRIWLVDEEKNAFASDVLVVLPKAKDPDYVYEPTEIISYENLEVRIEALEKGGTVPGGDVDLSEIEADIDKLQEDVGQLSLDIADLTSRIDALVDGNEVAY